MAVKEIDKVSMGKRLKALRLEAGKSIAEVSEATGIGETALRNYECGLRIPRYLAMFALADYYATSVDSLFF